MHQTPEPAAFALAARVLGALFYSPPDSETVAPLTAAFRDQSWIAQWPLPVADSERLAALFCQAQDEPLPQAFQRLFIGPNPLPAPPWGSVWLDRDTVLFGESTLALRQWLREHNIALHRTQDEPEDHIGTLLMLAAWLTEQGQQRACDELLAWHLLPWAERFLTVFCAQADHAFYQALGQLTQHTLHLWRQQLTLPVAELTLYR